MWWTRNELKENTVLWSCRMFQFKTNLLKLKISPYHLQKRYKHWRNILKKFNKVTQIEIHFTFSNYQHCFHDWTWNKRFSKVFELISHSNCCCFDSNRDRFASPSTLLSPKILFDKSNSERLIHEAFRANRFAPSSSIIFSIINSERLIHGIFCAGPWIPFCYQFYFEPNIITKG